MPERFLIDFSINSLSEQNEPSYGIEVKIMKYWRFFLQTEPLKRKLNVHRKNNKVGYEPLHIWIEVTLGIGEFLLWWRVVESESMCLHHFQRMSFSDFVDFV